ncbi:MAG: FtsX-like permease family protein [Rhodospirillales bacterium]|nr:MAG: FtsX-like permease family protein [Rhodospirillales bacterium]
MTRRPSELALYRDPMGRFLPWLVGFLVYIAVLAAAALFIVQTMTGIWQQDLAGRLTVQVPPAVHDSGKAENGLAAVLAEIEATPGVRRVEVLSDDAVMALLKPWLVDGVMAADLPLPRLIDVSAADPGAVLPGLRARLAEVDAGAMVDDHGAWRASVGRIGTMIEAIAAAVVIGIVVVTAGAVVVTTLSAIGLHRDEIDILHTIGARHGYVARQFAARAFRSGLISGAVGYAFAAVSLVALHQLALSLPAGMSLPTALSPGAWAVLSVIPLAVAALMLATTVVTVLRWLARRY